MPYYRPSHRKMTNDAKARKLTHMRNDPTREDRVFVMQHNRTGPPMTIAEERSQLIKTTINTAKTKRKNVPVTLPTIKLLVED